VLPAGPRRFAQDEPGSTTKVDVQLISTASLGRNFGEYAVYERPVNALNPRATVCSAQAIGERFNPGGKPPCTYSNRVDCMLGDLTGKFGFFPQTRVASTFFDNNLPLGGPNSIVGRSVGISDTDGARWMCATIVPIADSSVNAAGQNCSQLQTMGSCAGKIFASAAPIAGISHENVSAFLPASCPMLGGGGASAPAATAGPTRAPPSPTDAPVSASTPASTEAQADATGAPVDATGAPVAPATVAPTSRPPSSSAPTTAAPSVPGALVNAPPAKTSASSVPAQYDSRTLRRVRDLDRSLPCVCS
jgi:hypothetical protein